YDHLTAEEFMMFAAGLLSIPATEARRRTGRLLERAGLAGTRGLRLRKFSKGMVQRLGIAQALINDPDLVFLDEPMSGLDPVGRREVRNLILELRKEGKTIFFSTHILSDAETLCDRVAILDRGRLLGCGELEHILAMNVRTVEIVVERPSAQALEELKPYARAMVRTGDRVRIESDEKDAELLLGTALACGAHVHSFNPVKSSLEDYFMAQVGTPSTPADHPAENSPLAPLEEEGPGVSGFGQQRDPGLFPREPNPRPSQNTN
ncbi:MAG: ATP-binding cassette domain-containing protein, partial [Terriglobia bacterium]